MITAPGELGIVAIAVPTVPATIRVRRLAATAVERRDEKTRATNDLMKTTPPPPQSPGLSPRAHPKPGRRGCQDESPVISPARSISLPAVQRESRAATRAESTGLRLSSSAAITAWTKPSLEDRPGRALGSGLWKRRRSSGAADGCAAALRGSSSPRRTPPRARTGRGLRTDCRSPTSRTRSRSSRAATSRARTRGRSCAGCSSCTRSPATSSPGIPSLGDAFNAREAELERRVGRSAAGWLSAGRPRREAFRVGLRLTARAGVRELHDALADQAAALAAHARETKTALATDYTYLQPAQPTTVGHLLLAYAYPGPPRRRPGAPLARLARRERRRSRRQRRLPLGARPRAGSPSCSAARRSSSTRRTRPGRPTSTSSCSRRSRSPPRTRRSSARTSRSTRARSSASSSSPTRTAARAR